MSCKNCENSPYPEGVVAYVRFHTSDNKWVNVGISANGLCRQHLLEAMTVITGHQGKKLKAESEPVLLK